MHQEGGAGWKSGEQGTQRWRHGHTSPSPKPTQTDWGGALPLPRHYAPHPAQREQGTVRGWRAGGVAELVLCLKPVAWTRVGRERRGTHAFRDLVHRARRPQDRGTEIAEDRWRRMLGEALLRVDLDSLWETGRRPREQMLGKLLQGEGLYSRGQETRKRRGVRPTGEDPYRATR